MVKEKKPTLKDEAIEGAYQKCVKQRGKTDVVCVGLYAQAKAKMLTTEDYLDKMDAHIKRGGKHKSKKKEEHLLSEDE